LKVKTLPPVGLRGFIPPRGGEDEELVGVDGREELPSEREEEVRVSSDRQALNVLMRRQTNLHT
jgi:hypothetical protein